jgi:Uma2 family endonuclease
LPMADAAHKRATYDDVLAAPAGCIAELISGVLHTQPRPAGAHAAVASALGDELGPPFRRGRGGPGGWILLYEPELHLAEHVLVPDMAGWRRERMPGVRDVPYFTLPPDWVCEVLSPSTAKRDKGEKLPIYAAHGVGHAWLIDPAARTVEVWRLVTARWTFVGAYADDAKLRVEPFDAVEIDLGALWADLVVGEAPRST